jgi:hypothetical protein
MGDRKCAYRVLVGKYEGKRAFGRRRRRCEDNVKNASLRSRMTGRGLGLSGSG